MGLVYKRSTKKDATRYARTPGMVPNVGVAALSVINPGTPPRRRRRPGRNPAPSANTVYAWGIRRSSWTKPASYKTDSLAEAKRLARERVAEDDGYGGPLFAAWASGPTLRAAKQALARKLSKRATQGARGSVISNAPRTSRNTHKSRRRRTSRNVSRTSRTAGRTSRNPYQWVEGAQDKRGRRRRTLPKRTSAAYKTQARAESSGRRRATERSKLYIVDDLGNIICPVNRETKMKRNRGTRRNDAADDRAMMAAAGLGGTARAGRSRQPTARTSRRAKPKPKPKTSRRKSRRVSAKLGRKRIYLTGIPEIDRQLKAGKMPLMVQIPKKGKYGRPRTTAFVTPHYTSSMRRLHKGVSKKRPRYKKEREPVEVSFYGGEDFESMTKKEILRRFQESGINVDQSLTKAELVDLAEETTGEVWDLGTTTQETGRYVRANRRKKRTSRRRSSKRRTSKRATPRRRTSSGRFAKKRSTKRRTTKRRTTKRRSTKRRTSRRKPARRRSTKRRTSKRSSRRRSSRRTSRNRGRSSRRTSRRTYGVRMLNNPRAIMPKRKRKGKKRAGRSLYRYVPLGPKTSKRRKERSVPILLAPQIVEYAELQRIDPLAKARRARKKKKAESTSAGWTTWRGVTSNRRRRRRRRTSMKKNARRRTTRRNRTSANRRRRTSKRRRPSKRRSSRRRSSRRRTRRNQGAMGMAALRPKALWRDVGMPVLGGGLGFLGARALGSAAQNLAPLQEAVGDPWARAIGNSAGILATLVASARVRLIRQNRGPLIVGMGIALLDNLIAALGGEGGPLSFLSGRDIYSHGILGSYVDVANAGSPYNGMMGEYVEYSPVSGMGAYVTTGQDRMMGEYVEQGVSGMGAHYAEGIDPSDAATIEGMIDAAEYQAAAGLYEAAAGVGQVYEAAAGVGQVYEALAGPWRSPTMGSRMTAYQRSQVPEVSTLAPPMPARPITRDLPVDLPITESIATPEGRGHAGGIFGANLFAPMASC